MTIAAGKGPILLSASHSSHFIEYFNEFSSPVPVAAGSASTKIMPHTMWQP
nr:hypothetical protein [Mesorhizobium ciceri]